MGGHQPEQQQVPAHVKGAVWAFDLDEAGQEDRRASLMSRRECVKVNLIRGYEGAETNEATIS